MSVIVGAVFAVGLAVCVSIRDASIHHVADRVLAVVTSETHTGQPTHTITTDIGERQNVQLANGTELELNTHSIVHVSLDPASRHVTLERGETIMNVTDDNVGPWVLRCDDLEIEMRAAKVHVRCEPTEMASRLDVISGKASVRRAADIERALSGHPRSQSLLVQAGEFLLIRASLGVPSRFNPAELDRRMAWTQGMVVFQGDSLKDAVAELNRYNKRQLVIGDDSITSLIPGGTFNVTDVDEFASSLSKVFGVRVFHMRADGAGAGVIVLVGRDYGGV